ncbi:hypothetical protein EV182_001108 [Spiromyces aspiralis]|uniref:Uncharacterized protein n=1 Tax=Spiromyces aspiralis TaxID=68401 RepID=A0ACC1HGC3_9FUNG|nr:hypothetical protein EV182_001108 [Spiromyces aspiralis]
MPHTCARPSLLCYECHTENLGHRSDEEPSIDTILTDADECQPLLRGEASAESGAATLINVASTVSPPFEGVGAATNITTTAIISTPPHLSGDYEKQQRCPQPGWHQEVGSNNSRNRGSISCGLLILGTFYLLLFVGFVIDNLTNDYNPVLDSLHKDKVDDSSPSFTGSFGASEATCDPSGMYLGIRPTMLTRVSVEEEIKHHSYPPAGSYAGNYCHCSVTGPTAGPVNIVSADLAVRDVVLVLPRLTKDVAKLYRQNRGYPGRYEFRAIIIDDALCTLCLGEEIDAIRTAFRIRVYCSDQSDR